MDKKYVQFLYIDLRIEKKNEKTSIQHKGLNLIYKNIKVLLKVFYTLKKKI
jgi:hypothetical protein